MRNIITRRNPNRGNQLILGGVLIFVMVFSTLGFAFGNKTDETSKKIEYKGIKFVQDNSGYWKFNLQDYNFITKYNPQETSDIDFFTYLQISDYTNEPLYLVGEFQESNYEIAGNLDKFVLRTQKACLSKENCLEDLPIKNCSIDNVVIIQEPLDETDSENIYQEENCIFITADLVNQTKYSDVFLFKILGI